MISCVEGKKGEKES